jgi:phage major head subunit gpT-like protein
MAIVPSDIADFLTGALRASFFEAYNKVPVNYKDLVTEVPSTGKQETYGWLGAVPSMKEWTDERVPLGLLGHEFTIVNKDWEATIAVDRNALADDQLSQVKARINSLADEASRHLDELVFTLLADGFTKTCYDGQNFFDSDHSEGNSGTQSNLGSDELSAATYGAARAAMMRFKDDRGRPMGVIPDTLVVPPNLEETALQILNSDAYPATVGSASGVGNPWKGSAKLVVSPFLPDDEDWFLLCTSRAIRPLILQMRKPVEFTSLEENSDHGFMRKTYYFGVDARYNVGYGMWQFAYGSKIS